ncbi:MAG: hypothetical protein MI975_17685 [Cytophagales bacterium]|nr:hypothetical protein [Cytophagales bacterium]
MLNLNTWKNTCFYSADNAIATMVATRGRMRNPQRIKTGNSFQGGFSDAYNYPSAHTANRIGFLI